MSIPLEDLISKVPDEAREIVKRTRDRFNTKSAKHFEEKQAYGYELSALTPRDAKTRLIRSESTLLLASLIACEE